jgi:hypothetical protein
MAYYVYRAVTCPSKIPLGENAMSPAYLPPLEASLELQFTVAVQHSFNLRDIHKFSFPEGKFHLLEQKGLRKDVAIFFDLNFQVV